MEKIKNIKLSKESNETINLCDSNFNIEKNNCITKTKVKLENEKLWNIVLKNEKTELSDYQYLDYLAIKLNNPIKISLFLKNYIKYTDDIKGIKKDSSEPEYWQLAEETINRIKNWKMLWDCDDYAFLAKEILKRQWITSYIQNIPWHALCIWFEKWENWKWNASSLWTFWYDKNWNVYGEESDVDKQGWYNTLKEAINSLMVKYDWGWLWIDNKDYNYRITYNNINFMDISKKWDKTHINNIPINLIEDHKVFEKYILINNIVLDWNYKEAIEQYKDLIKKDNLNSNIYYSLIADIYKDKLFNNPEAQKYFLLAIENWTSNKYIYIKVLNYYNNINDIWKRINILNLMIKNCNNISKESYELLSMAYSINWETKKSKEVMKKIKNMKPKN